MYAYTAVDRQRVVTALSPLWAAVIAVIGDNELPEHVELSSETGGQVYHLADSFEDSHTASEGRLRSGHHLGTYAEEEAYGQRLLRQHWVVKDLAGVLDLARAVGGEKPFDEHLAEVQRLVDQALSAPELQALQA